MRQAALVRIPMGLLLVGCMQPGVDTEGERVVQPVVGGKPSATCAFPMTAKIPGCTSTLLTPNILVTAKHCGPKGGMMVQFGEKTPYAFSVRATKCVTANDSDSAYCVLPDDERLKKVPTVPPLHGCEYTKFMKAGAQVMGVGWGQTMDTGPRGVKNEVEVPVVRVGDRFIDVGDKDSDLCFGDSGGGAYIHLVEGGRDWGWRVIGTVTGSARVPGGAPCGGTDYTTILRHIKLIEQTEQIDVTPCTNEAGQWAPGPGCNALLTDIRTGGGAWPDCTPGPVTTLPIDSCSGSGAGGSGGTGGNGGAGGNGGGPDAGRSDGSAGRGGAGGNGGGTGGRDAAAPRDGAGGGGGPADSSPSADATSDLARTPDSGVAGSGGAGGGAGGTAPPGQTGGAGGATGSPPDAAAPPVTPPKPPSGGCACHLAAPEEGRGSAPTLALIMVLLGIWRMRFARRSAVPPSGQFGPRIR